MSITFVQAKDVVCKDFCVLATQFCVTKIDFPKAKERKRRQKKVKERMEVKEKNGKISIINFYAIIERTRMQRARMETFALLRRLKCNREGKMSSKKNFMTEINCRHNVTIIIGTDLKLRRQSCETNNSASSIDFNQILT